MTSVEQRVMLVAVGGWWLLWVLGGVLSSWAESDWSYLTFFGSLATVFALLIWGLVRGMIWAVYHD